MTKSDAKQEIQRLISNYKNLLDSNRINTYKEAQTRNEFIEPLFAALGWDMNQEGEVTSEESVSNGRVDLAFRLQGIPVMFLEAKALKVDLDEWKWAEQAINYSWNKSVSWAILTDFEAIKIFNSEIPPTGINENLFIEIKWNEYIERFEQLWLLSKDSFEQKKLETEAAKWGKISKRKPVGEKLFDDFMVWRSKLTRAFNKDNRLSKTELDEGIQRILDRLIFIRTAEDRKIEPNYLLEIYRNWQTASKSKNIYSQLVKLFRSFDEGYNLKIFAPHYCEKWVIGDKIISEIINGLYETEDGYRYDFSVITSDVLGGMYEQYLGYVQGRQTAEKVKSRRKSQGIYYTPKYIVDYIVKETLGKAIKQKKKKDLHKISVLDPACGSGSFLIAAFDIILENLMSASPQTSLFTKFDILKENIFGVDLDPQAIEIAQLNLLLKVLSQKHKHPILQHNISNGNSLVSGTSDFLESYFGESFRNLLPFNFEEQFKEVFDQNGFDVIIGNPPYVFARGGSFDEKMKKYYYDNFPLASYQLNTYLLFTDRAFRLLKKGGYFGYIIPNTWLTINTFSLLRKFLLEETGELQIINIFDKVFGDASVDSCILIFKKCKPTSVTLGEFKDGKLSIIGSFPPSQFSQNGYIINIALSKSKNKSAILNKITSNSKPLSFYSIPSTGLKAYQIGKGKPKQNKEIKENRVFHSEKQKNKTFKKYLEGRDVCRYYLGWSGDYLSYGDWLAEPRKTVPFVGKRILIRQIPSTPPYSINAVFTDKEFLNDINSMVVFNFRCNPLYLLAALNSKATTFWFVNTFDKFQRKTFPQFKVKELATFPIPNASEGIQMRIAGKAEQMLKLQKDFNKLTRETDKYTRLKEDISKLDDEIDDIFYGLYNFNKIEIESINNPE